jgi:hypothetical protein
MSQELLPTADLITRFPCRGGSLLLSIAHLAVWVIALAAAAGALGAAKPLVLLALAMLSTAGFGLHARGRLAARDLGLALVPGALPLLALLACVPMPQVAQPPPADALPTGRAYYRRVAS